MANRDCRFAKMCVTAIDSSMICLICIKYYRKSAYPLSFETVHSKCQDGLDQSKSDVVSRVTAV